MTVEQAEQILLNVVNNLQITHKDRETLWLAIKTLKEANKKD